MKKVPCILAGNKFLPKTKKSYLQERYKEEKEPKAKLRLLACIHRKNGFSIRQIAMMMGKAYSTIRDWLVRITMDGLVARYDKAIPGAPCKLDELQLSRLKEDVAEGPRENGFVSNVWMVKMVVAHAEKKFNVTYTVSSMNKLMRRLDLTYIKPRPRHPKSASKPEQEAFKQKARRTVLYYAKKGYTPLALDESSNILGWNIKGGWYPKNKKITTEISLSRKRFNTFGALANDEFYYRFYDKTNSDCFKDFINKLHKKYGKILLFMDNASYHKSEIVKEAIAKYKGDVVVRYFLPYTPELNPTEQQWRIIKKATANISYEDVEEMQNDIDEMAKNGEIGVTQISKYLRV